MWSRDTQRDIFNYNLKSSYVYINYKFCCSNSKADFTFLGGDFNSDPRAVNDSTYHLLKREMARYFLKQLKQK